MEDLAQVTRLNAQWNAAYQQRDRQALEEVLAQDWLGLAPDGSTGVQRAEMLERAVTDSPATLEFFHETVRLFGKTATVSGGLMITQADRVFRQQYLRIFAKRGGRWAAIVAQVIPAHSSPDPKPSSDGA